MRVVVPLLALVVVGSVSGQSALHDVENLRREVERLAKVANPASTEAERLELLERADALCDAADAEAGATATFSVRWKLAKGAYDLGAWSVASALYADLAAYYARHTGAENRDRLRVERLWAAALGQLEDMKPRKQRDYSRAFAIQKRVAKAWDAHLAKALRGPEPPLLDELDETANAWREVAITFFKQGDRAKALEQLLRVEDLVRKHIRRIPDPKLLRDVCDDFQTVLTGVKDHIPVIERTIALLQSNFPDRVDLVLALHADLAHVYSDLGQWHRAAETARDILDKAGRLDDSRPKVKAHAIRTGAQSMRNAGYAAETVEHLETARALLEKSGFASSDEEVENLMRELALTYTRLGRHDEAIRILTAQVERRPDVPWPYQNLGIALRAAGYYEEALDKFETARSKQPGTAAAGVMIEIANTHGLADAPGRSLAVLESLRRTVEREPSADTSVLDAILNAEGRMRARLGDFGRAYLVDREALRLAIDRLGEDELRVQLYRTSLSAAASWLGRYAESAELARLVRTTLTRIGRTDHPLYFLNGANLGELLATQGKLDEALDITRATHDATPNRFHKAYTRAILGLISLERGEFQRAQALLREGLEGMARLNPQKRPLLAFYRGKLLTALARLGERESLGAELRKMKLAATERLDRLSTLSVRARGAAVASLRREAEWAAALRRVRPDALDESMLFEWLATLRAVAGPIEVSRLHGTSPNIDKLRERTMIARRRVAAFSVIERSGDPAEQTRLLERAVHERDAAERALLRALPEGSRFGWIDDDALAVELREREAVALAIHRIRAAPPHQKRDRFLAFVLDGRKRLRTEDLGPAEAIESKVEDWRAAVLASRRGRRTDSNSNPRTTGIALREAVLDKTLRDIAARHVFLCVDDALNTVAWDALPAKDGNELVGDTHRFAVLSSFRDLLESRTRRRRQPALVVVGDIDYSAAGNAANTEVTADSPQHWDSLPFSADEVRDIAARFATRYERKPALLTRRDATKDALFGAAPKATYLHLSTHGYFASEAVRMLGDPGVGPAAGEVVTGLAPMTLCGIALAGANHPPTITGDVAGIVTAEELAGLDLSACQLAVLSGCETSLGVRRAGQGLASLQAALHAAGARATVTSLWQVPDATTSKLMRRFYENLWRHNLPPDEALWKAKKSLQREPLVAWAGWVFSGVPERGR